MVRKLSLLLTLLIIASMVAETNTKSILNPRKFNVASPKVIWVPGDYPTIQAAINAAEENDIIRVNASTYNEQIIINKSISLIGENKNTTIINGSGTGKIVWVKANNVIVSGFTFQHGEYGVFVESVNNCTIRGNHAKNNVNGIFLYHSWNCLVQENNVTDNGNRGIFLTSSGDSTIIENFVSNSSWYGINLNASMNCWVSQNIVGNNRFVDGLGLTENTNSCRLTLNTVYNNMYGIWIDKSNNNVVYHNNFFNNFFQALVANSHDIVWDASYPSGGNYWSNYTGVDIKSGPYQNETGNDALGDKAYTSGGAYDRYPIIKPISFFDVGVWNNQAYFTTTISNSTVTDFFFKPEQTLMSFNVSGKDATRGFCRVAIPKKLLWVESGENWLVHLDYVKDITSSCHFYEDNDFTFIYIPYNHTTHIIQVFGTHAIPTFSLIITASPPTQTVTPGNNTTYTVYVSAFGPSPSITLNVSGLPSGITYSFTPQPVTPNGTSTLKLIVSTSTQNGTYTLTITGTGGGVTEVTTVNLVVAASPAPSPFPIELYLILIAIVVIVVIVAIMLVRRKRKATT